MDTSMEETKNTPKQYTNVAIQTAAVADSVHGATGVSICPTSSSVIANTGAYKCSTCGSLTSTDEPKPTSLVHSLCLSAGTQAVNTKIRLPRVMPVQSSKISGIQPRVVSLPKKITSELQSGISHEASVAQRSVSLPASYLQFLRSCTTPSHGAAPHLSFSSSVDASENTKAHVSARSPDLPCTPSPPSTPDSVEFVDNSVHFPDAFLRVDAKQQKDIDDDGWVSWASSPPRPIPALHGPASLPYARCPSGAEGTVIADTTDVPRLIWGLNEDGNNQKTASSIGLDHTNRDVGRHGLKRTVLAQKVSRNSSAIDHCGNMQRGYTHSSAVDQLAKLYNGAQNNLCAEGHAFVSADLGLSSGAAAATAKTARGEMNDVVSSCAPNLNAQAPSFVPAMTTQVGNLAYNLGDVDERTLAVLRLQTELQLAKLQAQLAAYQSTFAPLNGDDAILPTPPHSSLSLCSPQLPLFEGASGVVAKLDITAGASPVAHTLRMIETGLITCEGNNCASQDYHSPVHDSETSDESYPPTPQDSSYAFPESQVTSIAFRRPMPFRDPSLPEMPIHLPDLVPQHTPKISSVMNSPGPHTSVLFTPLDAAASTRRKLFALNETQPYPSPTSPAEEATQNRPAFGRRMPRSIPLTRLVNRRLASVPEESSVISCDESKDVTSRSFDELLARKSQLEQIRDTSPVPTDASPENSSLLVSSSQSSFEEDNSVSIASEDIKVKLPASSRVTQKVSAATTNTVGEVKSVSRKCKERKGPFANLGFAKRGAGRWHRRKD